MSQISKQKITKTITVIGIIIIFTIGAYTYPKPEPIQAKADKPSLEDLKKLNSDEVKKAEKALEDKKLEAQILELKEKQQSLKVQS